MLVLGLQFVFLSRILHPGFWLIPSRNQQGNRKQPANWVAPDILRKAFPIVFLLREVDDFGLNREQSYICRCRQNNRDA